MVVVVVVVVGVVCSRDTSSCVSSPSCLCSALWIIFSRVIREEEDFLLLFEFGPGCNGATE